MYGIHVFVVALVWSSLAAPLVDADPGPALQLAAAAAVVLALRAGGALRAGRDAAPAATPHPTRRAHRHRPTPIPGSVDPAEEPVFA